MIKEAILKSVLILSMRSRAGFPSRIPNHLQLLHSQITRECDITLCSTADAHKDFNPVKKLHVVAAQFSNQFSPVAIWVHRCTVITLLVTMKAEGIIKNSTARRKSHGASLAVALLT